MRIGIKRSFGIHTFRVPTLPAIDFSNVLRFLDDLRRDTRPPLGIDFGRFSITAVLMKNKNGVLVIDKFLSVPIKAGTYHEDGSLACSGRVLNALVEIRKHFNLPSSYPVSFNVRSKQTHTKPVPFPPMSEDQMYQSLHWHTEQYIPFDIRKVHMDAYILGEDTGTDDMRVLLSAVKNEEMEEKMALLAEAGFKKMTVATISPMAIRQQLRSCPDIGGDVTAVVDIRGNNDVSIFKNGQLIFTRTMDTGLKDCYRQLDSSQPTVESFDDESRAFVLTAIMKDVQRSLDFYASTSLEGQIKNVILTGDFLSLSDEDVRAIFEEFLSLPVLIFNPFSNKMSKSIECSEVARFTVAAGLAQLV